MGPAIPIALAIGGGIVKGLASRKKAPRYWEPNKGYLKGYEQREHEDVEGLYGEDPYGGKGLGFSKEVMEARMGPAMSESTARFKSDVGAIERRAAGAGMRRTSGAYYRGLQRAGQGALARESDIYRRNLIEDAFQRRQDYYRRLGATQGAYRYGTNLYNIRKGGKAQGQSTFQAVGGGLGEGMMGAAASIPVK